jgi:hypothetical protein
MRWTTTGKRYGIACFLNAHPREPESEGDSAQFLDKLEDAQDWAEKALTAGRFKYLALWDGVSGQWQWLEEFPPSRDAEPPIC